MNTAPFHIAYGTAKTAIVAMTRTMAVEPTDPQWSASSQPGWQEEGKRNFHRWSPFQGVVFDAADQVCDFWTELGRNTTARIAASPDPHTVL